MPPPASSSSPIYVAGFQVNENLPMRVSRAGMRNDLVVFGANFQPANVRLMLTAGKLSIWDLKIDLNQTTSTQVVATFKAAGEIPPGEPLIVSVAAFHQAAMATVPVDVDNY